MPLYMTWEQIEMVRHRYVCSDCWEPVTSRKIGDDLYEIKCDTHGCTTPALVSLSSVDWRIRKKTEEIVLARKSLYDALPWLKKDEENLSPEEIMKKLGY
jgi:hypothetical protein